MKTGKFEYWKAKNGEYRFRLKARNGKTICQSEGYNTKASCIIGIKSVAGNARKATVVCLDHG
jgi:uncharacterized protein YegP (UPF0339 family)